jgi:hypothetical protein
MRKAPLPRGLLTWVIWLRGWPAATLFEEEESFSARAGALRRRLRSTMDGSALIRADRDRDHTT